jgi:hypothetical protein
MADERKTDRFAIRRDSEGWSVYEIFTGEVAVIALTPQTGLSEDDAKHTAELLNKRARQGDRSLRR